jgi:hypothetical protein
VGLIDADGLFYGDRMAKLSLMARLYWPYFFCASNAYGRLELNYHRLSNRAFARFPQIPSESEINSYLKEYKEAFLLFVYESNGQRWGAWDVSEKFLPRHKDAASKRSPDPGPAFLDWKNRYSKAKEASLRASVFDCNVFTKPAQDGEMLCENVRGVGVGVGVGGGVNTCSPDGERVTDLFPVDLPPGKTLEPPAKAWGLSEKKRAFQEEFWPLWPRKTAKGDAEAAWRKHATSRERADSIIKALGVQLPQLSAARMSDDGKDYCPYPASWLNGKRYEDDPEVQPGRSNGSIYADYQEAAE